MVVYKTDIADITDITDIRREYYHRLEFTAMVLGNYTQKGRLGSFQEKSCGLRLGDRHASKRVILRFGGNNARL
jgi:hypothetical protein